MKQKASIIRLATAAILLSMATSCMNDVYDPDKEPTIDPVGETFGLEIPSTFSWATTRNAELTISTPVTTSVSLYGDEQGKELLAEAIVTKDKPSTLTLDMPTSKQKIYVGYTVKGVQKVLKQDLGATTRANISITLPEEVDWRHPDTGDASKGDMTVYMPSKGNFGTLLFEDKFPVMGDYDMNDFVVGYSLAPYYSVGSKTTHYEGTDIRLQIRAIGGTLPHRLCVELSSLHTSDIADATGIYYTTSSTNPNISVELLSSGNEPVVFAINGTNTLKEDIFFNVGDHPTSQPLPVVTISIQRDLKDNVAMSKRYFGLLTSENYNFFLQNTVDKKEIHMKGYNVTPMASNQTGNNDFATSENLVWGIKVPALIPHAREGINIQEAYPCFANWVKSNGSNDPEWYTIYNKKKVVE
ncbi:MAG: LruC domain-containing protein [Bacteroidales bacterium]|nr:LruC domain-containing protein [Bacteroidales bacterium]